MKCALVIPPWTPEDIFPGKTVGSQINYWQPLGTLYVAAALRSAGHEVRFFNGAFLSKEDILAALGAFAPAVVGVYSTTFGWPRARMFSKDVKRMFPGVFTVAGGPYPIAARASCLEDCEDLDAVVTGEGELTMVELLDRLGTGDDLFGIKGLVYRMGGAIQESEDRPLIEDLDAVPFPSRELLGDANDYIPAPATYKRTPVAVMLTSRGCTRHCLYCFQMDRSRATGIRYRSVENVLGEIELLLGQGFREIKFIDDTLAADYGRAMELATEIRRRGLDFTWFASACANQVDRPLLEAFRAAGCWAILIGAESGVQKNLNRLRKGTTLEQIRLAVRTAKKAGLTVFTPFVFGIPGETYEEGLKTIEFACELDPDVANFHALTPFPGTDLYDRRAELGTVSENLEDYTYQGAAFVPFSMTRKELVSLRQRAFVRFYSRPRFLLRRLLNLRTRSDLKAAMAGLRSLFWMKARKDVLRPGERKAPQGAGSRIAAGAGGRGSG